MNSFMGNGLNPVESYKQQQIMITFRKISTAQLNIIILLFSSIFFLMMRKFIALVTFSASSSSPHSKDIAFLNFVVDFYRR